MRDETLTQPRRGYGLIWLNVLSLDAVAVALVWLAVFGQVNHVHMQWENYLTLGAAVWCLYVLDRVMDGFSSTGPALERHVWSRRHAVLLLLLMVPVVAAAVWAGLYHIREGVLRAGGIVGVGCLLSLALSWLSRQKWPGKTGALAMGGLFTILLMQGMTSGEDADPGEVLAGSWRALLGGLLFTVMWMSLRVDAAPAPWTLPRKIFMGWLFAAGVALAPVAHAGNVLGVLRDPEIAVFAAVCTLNSLGIRLWEAGARTAEPDIETTLLTRLYPAFATIIAAGAALEFFYADQLGRPAILGCGIAAACYGVMHFSRQRIPADWFPLLADGILVACGFLALAIF